MGDWYTIGVAAGLGVAVGILAAGFIRNRWAVVVLAALVGLGLGLLVENWQEAVAGFVGGFLGGLGAWPVVSGALRRGGTRGGLAILVTIGAVIAAALAFVPIVGYVMAVVLPAFGLRMRSREPERHAGLRTLARD
jgi:hypothetical protein